LSSVTGHSGRLPLKTPFGGTVYRTAADSPHGRPILRGSCRSVNARVNGYLPEPGSMSPPVESRAFHVCCGISEERQTSKFMGYCWKSGMGFCTLEPLNTERMIFGHCEIFRHRS
jgi:hypothetical protein